MQTNPLTRPHDSEREDEFERAIRPRLLADYVGQAPVREQMDIFIQAAKNRGEALDHVLIFGPPVQCYLHHGRGDGDRIDRASEGVPLKPFDQRLSSRYQAMFANFISVVYFKFSCVENGPQRALIHRSS